MLITELQANGNGRQVIRPPPQGELRKRNAICVFITEVQAADSTVGANERRERHEVIQGLTFMCPNARGQGDELEEEKEGMGSARRGAGGARSGTPMALEFCWYIRYMIFH